MAVSIRVTGGSQKCDLSLFLLAGYRRYGKRSAEAEPEAEASYGYGNYGNAILFFVTSCDQMDTYAGYGSRYGSYGGYRSYGYGGYRGGYRGYY